MLILQIYTEYRLDEFDRDYVRGKRDYRTEHLCAIAGEDFLKGKNFEQFTFFEQTMGYAFRGG